MPSVFFVTASAAAEIYTLSLHDALPILLNRAVQFLGQAQFLDAAFAQLCVTHDLGHDFVRSLDLFLDNRELLADVGASFPQDRKSTRLNSSHEWISYAVFCLKKKKQSPDYNTITDISIPNIDPTPSVT